MREPLDERAERPPEAYGGEAVAPAPQARLSRRQLLRLGGLAALTGLLGEAGDACSAGASERSVGGASKTAGGRRRGRPRGYQR